MDYQKHYDNLVNRARNRSVLQYTEKHHIVPRCMGGTDEESNLVKLTPEEHFVAHQLLVKLFPNNQKLIYAAVVMTRGHNGKRNNNKMFGWIRKQFAITHSKAMKGQKKPARTLEHSNNISKALTGKKRPNHSTIMKNIEWSAESIQKRTLSLTGKVYNKIQCPHCNKMGAGSSMKRYHLDNCKQKETYK